MFIAQGKRVMLISLDFVLEVRVGINAVVSLQLQEKIMPNKKRIHINKIFCNILTDTTAQHSIYSRTS